MSKIIFTAFICFLGFNLSGQDLTPNYWHTGEENTIIETYQKDGKWFGKIISSDNEKAKIGKDILQGFEKVDGEWTGQLFAAKRGRLVDAVIVPTNQSLEITVSAGIIKKQLTWKKHDQ